MTFYSLDDWIDHDALHGADAEIRAVLADPTGLSVNLGDFKIAGEPAGPKKIRLRERVVPAAPGSQHFEYGEAECWRDPEQFAQFPNTRALLNALPLHEYGRAIIIICQPDRGTPMHTDHALESLRQEFIWLRTSLAKPFFIADRGDPLRRRRYVEGYSGWFDSRDFHGSDATGDLTISIRIDGRFNAELRCWLQRLGAVV